MAAERLPRSGCGTLRGEHAGDVVRLCGWVHRRRDLGGVVFIDLRDRSGIVQVVFAPDAGTLHERASRLRPETVVELVARIESRPAQTENASMPTGAIEARAQSLTLLADTDDLPLQPAGQQEPGEETRLRYRYLDLRRSVMQHALGFRSEVVRTIRGILHEEQFWDVETPILTRSTPEGARDFLVPSRVHGGKFYALPQSPQLFKQLLMVAGVERYYQIARCFRDEDLRADRQPEFTQVDLEMSFVEPDDVMAIVEKIMRSLAGLAGWGDVAFPHIEWQEAMSCYGRDAPDMRYGLEIVDATDVAGRLGFVVFDRVVSEEGAVRGIVVPGAGGYTRRQLDGLTARAKELGASGLVWFRWGGDGISGPAAKAIGPEGCTSLLGALGASAGDLALVVAGAPLAASRVLGLLRAEIAQAEGLIPADTHAFVWVTGFPLFEWDEEMSRWFACHHPFTSPEPEHLPLLLTDPGRVRARAYDLVLDGVEIGGGSIRIHRHDVQEKVFRVLGIEEEEARARFGFLLEALRYGAPPHGGIALGLDRIVALLLGHASIREVIAFPKTTSGACPLTGAPSVVDAGQLDDLELRLTGE